jgi:hypothetical protein
MGLRRPIWTNKPKNKTENKLKQNKQKRIDDYKKIKMVGHHCYGVVLLLFAWMIDACLSIHKLQHTDFHRSRFFIRVKITYIFEHLHCIQ